MCVRYFIDLLGIYEILRFLLQSESSSGSVTVSWVGSIGIIPQILGSNVWDKVLAIFVKVLVRDWTDKILETLTLVVAPGCVFICQVKHSHCN